MDSTIKTFNYQTIDSTNEEVKRKINGGEKTPFLVISDSQTKGKGRKGRSFYSPSGSGIYFSLCVKSSCKDKAATIIAASAVVSVLLSMDKIPEYIKEEINIKWVNDIRRNSKKFCGILAELIEKDGVKYLVVGIGINVYQDNFPRDISNIAISLLDTEKHIVDKEKLVKDIVNKFFELYERNDFVDIYKKYCKIIGKNVIYDDFKSKTSVKIIDITNKGELVIDNGIEKKIVSNGEINLVE